MNSHSDSIPCKTSTVEFFVLYWAQQTAYQNHFAIEYIRWEAFFQDDLYLSYKQVRNALFRLRRKGLAIKHIGRGVYRFVEKEE